MMLSPLAFVCFGIFWVGPGFGIATLLIFYLCFFILDVRGKGPEPVSQENKNVRLPPPLPAPVPA